MSIPFLSAFLLAISIIFSMFKTPWLVATRLTTNTTTAQNFLHWLPIQQWIKSILNCLLLSTVDSITLALNTYHLYYILIRHRVSFALPPSIYFSNLVSILLLPLVVFDTLALLIGIPCHHLGYIVSYTVFKSNLKTHLFSSASIYVDFCILKLYYIKLCYVRLCDNVVECITLILLYVSSFILIFYFIMCTYAL